MTWTQEQIEAAIPEDLKEMYAKARLPLTFQLIERIARLEADLKDRRLNSVSIEALQNVVDAAKNLKQRAETAEANLKNSAKANDLLRDALAEREKEISELKEYVENADNTLDMLAKEGISLRSRLATAREIIKKRTTMHDLSCSHTMRSFHEQSCDCGKWEAEKWLAALAATEEGKEDHGGTDRTAD